MSVLQARRSLRRATQAEQEAGTSNVVVVTPATQQNHLSAAKAWLHAIVTAGAPAISGGYNIASLTDGGVGILTITFTTAFSSANWVGVATPLAGSVMTIFMTARNASSCTLHCFDNTFALVDPGAWNFMAFGDQ